MGAGVYQQLKGTLKQRRLTSGVGDEGGFAPALESNEAPLELLVTAIEAAGYRAGDDVAICLDPLRASSSSTAATSSRAKGVR
jgi:enolase